MFEILNILLQFLIFILIFSFPFCIYKKKVFLLPNSFLIQGSYLKMGLNILIHLFGLLFISFFKIDLNIYFYVIVISSLISNFIFIVSKDKFEITLNTIIIFIFFILITLGFFFKIAIDLKLEWDGLNHWLPKTLLFFEGTKINNLNKLGFSEYPHLGPFVWAFFWKNSLLQYEYFGRLFYVFFYVTSLFSILDGKFEKDILFKIVIIFFTSILTYDLFLFGGYQEYLIFSSLLILSKCFYETKFNQNNSNNKFFNIFIITIFHILIWFKDEGIFYFLIFFLTFIYISKFKNKILLTLFCIFFVILQYFLQKFLIGNYGFQAEIIHKGLIDNFHPEIFFNKFLMITKYFLISSLKYKLWIINMFSLTIIFFFHRDLLVKLKIWVYILILNIFLIYAIFFQTPYFSEFLLKVTLDRVMFQTSAFYIIFTIAVLERIFRGEIKPN